MDHLLIRRIVSTTACLGIAFSALARAQATSIYSNYAENTYQRDKVVGESQKIYDLFGEHVVDGFEIYGLTNQEKQVYGQQLGDSTYLRVSREFEDIKFYTELNALCLSQDVVGKSKMLFMIGDHLNTKFTPLTLNKRYFGGLRWDLWSSGLKMTTLLTRTRPGVMAHTNGSIYTYEYAAVTYPMLGYTIDDIRDADDWYLEATDPSHDWTQKTFFGDYDLLFALHAENNLANIMNVGVTYINHHRSDINEGEKFFTGELPDAFSPNEIHFEMGDMTSGVTNDAGARMESIHMFINGRDAGGPYKTYHIVDYYHLDTVSTRDGLDTTGYYKSFDLLSVSDSTFNTVHGTEGLVYTFRPKDRAQALGIDTTAIRDVEFSMVLSGNYRVFASCEKLTPQDDVHFNKKDVTLEQKTLEEVFGDTTLSRFDGIGGFVEDRRHTNPQLNSAESEVYYGDYIVQAPYPVYNYSNRRVFRYRYTIPVSNVTYGVNFNGEIGGFSYKGEYALCVEQSQVPYAAGRRDTVKMHAGYLQLNYDLPDDRYRIFADVYNIDADYHTGLGSFYVSQYFNAVTNPSRDMGNEPMYFVYPRVLDNEYTLVDDNDDDDYYVENERRKYPAESSLPAGLSQLTFYGDGTIKSYAHGATTSDKIDQILEKRVLLPTGLYRYYDDQDGVIDSKYDENQNGSFDYQEDFLLYRADIPVFRLEADDNNNGIYDAEEDDFAPDYPYQTGLVYVGNNVKSLGVRGISYGTELKPLQALNLKLGGVYEKVLDSDLDEKENGLYNGVGLNRNYYLRGRYDRSLRDVGMAYGIGLEIKRVWDGIKNDAVITHKRFSNIDQDVDYTLQTDQLRYFNAMTALMTAGFDYNKIANLNVSTEIAAGYETHYQADDSLLVTRNYVRDTEVDTYSVLPIMYVDLPYVESDFYKTNSTFRTEHVAYDDMSTSSLHFRLKGDYTFRFSKEYRGRYTRYLNVLQQLQITPAYQLYYVNRSSSIDDPRDTYAAFAAGAASDSALRAATDTLGLRLDWNDYLVYNESVLYNVPMIQVSFKIGERTMLQAGFQWMGAKDFIAPGESFSKQSFIAQLVNRTTLQGYDVAIIFGMLRTGVTYDELGIDTVFGIGHENHVSNSSVFCKIYAGLKQK